MLVVIGSGPGIGSATAARFAVNGFSRVVLIARNADRLTEDCRLVEDAAQKAGKSVDVGCYAVDITDTNAYKLVLDKVAKFGSLECVFFNAARVEQSVLLELSVEEIEYDFKVGRRTHIECGVTRSDTSRLPTLHSTPLHSGRFPNFKNWRRLVTTPRRLY